jgi:hypothetical protein
MRMRRVTALAESRPLDNTVKTQAGTVAVDALSSTGLVVAARAQPGVSSND